MEETRVSRVITAWEASKIIELIDEDFVAEVVDLPELVYDDVEMYGMVSGHHKSHQSQNVTSPDRSSHTSKPLFRRIFNFLKQTWTGVKFSLGKCGPPYLRACFRISLSYVPSERMWCMNAFQWRDAQLSPFMSAYSDCVFYRIA